jgi:hypothetical protein
MENNRIGLPFPRTKIVDPNKFDNQSYTIKKFSNIRGFEYFSEAAHEKRQTTTNGIESR